MPILIGILLLVVLTGYVILFRRSVFILAYHGVGLEISPIPELMLHPRAFKKQMRLLAALGFRSVPVDSLVENLLNWKADWRGSLCITFDDGYRNTLENAFPILRSMGWTATVFVPTDHVGGQNDWDKVEGTAPLQLLDWKELDLLVRMGIHIGSHGKTHHSLLMMPEAECLQELCESLTLLQSRLPGSSRVLAYPFGHRHPGLARLARQAGYIGACSMVAGALPDRDDLFDLGRLVVRRNSLMLFLLDLAWYPVVSLGRNLRNELERWKKRRR